MKEVLMKRSVINNGRWEETGTEKFYRVSRWKKVYAEHVTPRHSLFDYATDESGNAPGNSNFDPDTATVTFFRHNGRKYAVSEFIAFGNSFWNPVLYSYEDENGKLCILSGTNQDFWNPLFVELDECGEYVRVYQQ